MTQPYELKEQALLERMAELVAQYENHIANLRVQITLMGQEAKDSKSDDTEPDVS